MNAPRFVCQSRLSRLINLKRWSLNDGLDFLFFSSFLLVPLFSVFSPFFLPSRDR